MSQQVFKRWALLISLVLIPPILWQAWTSAWARTATLSTYTSYASGDFFFPPYPSDSDRMGVGGAIAYYTAPLQAGWYTDWGADPNPPHPDGVEYARLIYFSVNTPGSICGSFKAPASQRSHVIESITGTALIENLRANPGALWLIGNEPDSIYNGSPIMPELYAELYHEFYTFIKTHDPTARVAIAAIVQPSPLRLEYLDKVLNHYQALYGEQLSTALWNIHMYTLREVACSYGAGVPPGAGHDGWTYEWWQWSDINLLKQHLPEMRQWMAAHGERDKPLIITEFGMLMPDDGSWCWQGGCITQETSRDYLRDSFTYLLTTTHPEIGYPADGNRLVQAWAWYSLYDSFYGGDLVYLNGALTPAGQAFAQIASSHRTSYVDLYPVPLVTPTIPPGSSSPTNVSLTVQLDNRGNQTAQSVPVRFAQYNYLTGQLLASTEMTVSQVLTRYGGTQPQVNATWPLTPETIYTLTFTIDPSRTLSQAHRSEQQLTFVVGEPDLRITGLTTDYPIVYFWDKPITWTFTATVHNLGYTTSSMGKINLSARDTQGIMAQSQETVLPALAPNVFLDVTSTLVLTSPDTYTVIASVEYTRPHSGAEGYTMTLLVGEPDLAITSLDSVDTVDLDQDTLATLAITATVRNLGYTTSPTGTIQFNTPATGVSVLRQIVPIPDIPPNASIEITNSLVLSLPGTHVITATVQYAGLDLNPQNDTATRTILAVSHKLYLPLVLRSPS